MKAKQHRSLHLCLFVTTQKFAFVLVCHGYHTSAVAVVSFPFKTEASVTTENYGLVKCDAM